jgi:hypothetical protein
VDILGDQQIVPLASTESSKFRYLVGRRRRSLRSSPAS